jgi:hypothetical protein
VRDDLSPSFQDRLGDLLRSNNYEIAPFLRTVFLSRDFYSPASIGTHIKEPVELIVPTYRRLGLKATPGMPDFNSTSADLGQSLLNPPTVAGWSQGRAWITPGSLLQRGNFARAVLLPDVIAFTDPHLDPYPPQLRAFSAHIRAGEDITTASKHADGAESKQPEAAGMATASLLSEHEEFNTHYASVNTPPPKGGGFGLRLKAGSVGLQADCHWFWIPSF